MAKKKSRINILESLICKGEKALEKLKKIEAKARAKWTRGYRSFKAAAENLAKATIRQFETKKYERWTKTVSEWGEKNVEWTKERNEARDEIKKQEEELQKLRVELASLVEKVEAERKATDEIVNTVFALNESVVEAFRLRNDYLTEHVYNRLVDEKGNLRSQLTIISSDGLRKIVAIVASITKVDPDLATRAGVLIDQFFEKFVDEKELTQELQTFYDITRQLLDKKIRFKVGPKLYEFLGLELDEKAVPELHEAQMLLRRSLRSEKTESYVKLYYKEKRNDSWISINLK